jgi:hypothetical protein
LAKEYRLLTAAALIKLPPVTTEIEVAVPEQEQFNPHFTDSEELAKRHLN